MLQKCEIQKSGTTKITSFHFVRYFFQSIETHRHFHNAQRFVIQYELSHIDQCKVVDRWVDNNISIAYDTCKSIGHQSVINNAPNELNQITSLHIKFQQT